MDESLLPEPATGLATVQILVEVMREQRKVFYKGEHISIPASLAGRQYCRTVADDEFLLSDPDTGEVVMSFPPPVTAMYRSGKYIASYSIRGIQIQNPTVHWELKAERYRKEHELRETQMREVFSRE